MSVYDPNLVSTKTSCRVYAPNQSMGCMSALVPTVGKSGGYFKKMRRIRGYKGYA